MSALDDLKDRIDSAIYTNTEQNITGDGLQTVLDDMVDTMGVSVSQNSQTGNITITVGSNTYIFRVDTSVESSEYIKAWVDNDSKFLMGIKTDGSIEWSKGIPTPIQNALTEIEGKIATLIESNEFLEVTIDTDNKIVSARDKTGKLHENVGIETNSFKAQHYDYTQQNLSDLEQALRESGYVAQSPIDWSDSDFVEIPSPRTCVIINLKTDSQATSKDADIECDMEFWDKDGNYFKKPVVLNAQGSSSMSYQIKNQAIDINDGSKIKIGDWVAQDSFHIKKYFIDVFRGQCIVGYWLGEQVYKTREFGKQRPFDYLMNNAPYNGSASGVFDKDFESGALCHPDGFPCHLFFNGTDAGIYAFNLKKHRDNYKCGKNNQKNIILDGVLGTTFFTANGNLNAQGEVGTEIWNDFEVRNPKIAKDINGNDYDGDHPTEPSNDYAEAKGYIEDLTKAIPAINAASTDVEKKEIFENTFNLDFLIDYDLQGQVIYNYDGYSKNWIWCCWDGILWTPTYYDQDSIFGQHWNGASNVDGTTTLLGTTPGKPTAILHTLYKSEMDLRYKELRDNGIFSVDNIIGLMEKWVEMCGYDNLKNDITKIVVCNATDGNNQTVENVPYTPSYRDGDYTYPFNPTSGGWYNSITRIKNWLVKRFEYLDTYFNYSV